MRQAIYREYRPKTFDEVLGQSQVTEVLKNQVKNNLIGHAYLFSGTRGTGKTSCAKIFARAINCLNLQDGSPCNVCENCRSILNEETFDIVEMDAASNRRIEDIRDLRDKVIYPPANLKYKVYIIDEAHMITNEGFNALLKIMEEPPKHLVFILATTEIEKIPQTILSRCQRYEFKRLDTEFIKENILNITRDLGVEIEPEAVNLIANEADGAMRDALSTLDQVISLGKDKITVKDLEEDLGLVDQDKIFKLVDAIISKDFSNTIKAFAETSKGKIISNLFKDLTDHYRNLLLVKNKLESNVDASTMYLEKYKEQANNIEMNQIIESLDILMEFEIKLKTTENPVILGELLVTRLVDYVNYNSFKSKINYLEDKVKELEEKLSNLKVEDLNSNGNIDIVTTNNSVKDDLVKAEIITEENKSNITETEDSKVEKEENPSAEKVENSDDLEDDVLDKYKETKYWNEIVNKLPTPMMRNFINSSTYRFLEKNRLVILFKTEDTKMKLICSNINVLKKIVQEVVGSDYDVHITLESSYPDLNNLRKEKNLKLIQDLFGEDNINIT
ncbi:DNA polymerase III subunit gamma/tau [Miniphocaeibacter halophilus]|uniref:DNA polymerase III subunit gamma/tau n=1 Tax=Miniphocaeibacter halophilus TaxID=2931922 RepID=A0AC61MXX1_9FIRM|nr:DNA polymerase III subunit gamma/tau [Miniphocaeibacter halophilus]QQK08314.1 DNA polymerase III subunit gamma/tau [Miniphocaeibacter halophilus]